MDGTNLIFLTGFQHAHRVNFSDFYVFIGPVGHDNVESA